MVAHVVCLRDKLLKCKNMGAAMMFIKASLAGTHNSRDVVESAYKIVHAVGFGRIAALRIKVRTLPCCYTMNHTFLTPNLLYALPCLVMHGKQHWPQAWKGEYGMCAGKLNAARCHCCLAHTSLACRPWGAYRCSLRSVPPAETCNKAEH